MGIYTTDAHAIALAIHRPQVPHVAPDSPAAGPNLDNAPRRPFAKEFRMDSNLKHLCLRPQLRLANAIHAIAADARPTHPHPHGENDSGVIRPAELLQSQ